MLRNAIVMATSTTNSVIGHVVYTKERVVSVKTDQYGSIIVELDESVPCIVDGNTIKVNKIKLSRKNLARAAYEAYPGIEQYMKAKENEARKVVKDYNKRAMAENRAVKNVETTVVATINMYWSEIFAYSNLSITPIEYAAGEELGAGIVANNDGYRYEITAIKITNEQLLADIDPLDDELLTALGR